jgi:hypothetical protein
VLKIREGIVPAIKAKKRLKKSAAMKKAKAIEPVKPLMNFGKVEFKYSPQTPDGSG